jgi:hypothetical protein
MQGGKLERDAEVKAGKANEWVGEIGAARAA